MNLQTFNYYLLIFSISLLGLVCCSQIETHTEDIHPELRPYYDRYHKLLDQYCPEKHYNTTTHYFITFLKDMKDYNKEMDAPKNINYIGMCTKLFNGFTIEINREYWDRSSYTDKDSLIFHELSHCLLDKPHVSDPNNYMYAMSGPIEEEVLIKQVVADIEERCVND